LGKCGWLVRLYQSNNYTETVDVIGNFPQYHNRQKDDVMVFSGMYGIDNYFIWYMHKNIGNYDFASLSIELSLYIDENPELTFWRRQYRIIDMKYDSNKSQYVLYAISSDSAKLQTKLVNYGVKSLPYKDDPPRLPRDVLVDILEKNEIFKVEYMESPYEKDLRNFEYRKFNIDEEWSVWDFIHYIAEQNQFEWYVRDNVLYIGNECKAIKSMNSTRKFDIDTDNVSSTPWFRKYYGETRPMDVMSHINETYRCVWAKHMAGASGGLSKGCFTKIGEGCLNKTVYLNSLEGDIERDIASKLFAQHSPSDYITLGNILKDEGDPVFVDQVSVNKYKPLYKINEPSDIKINRGDDTEFPILQSKENVVRSTPYLDDGAGILFPSPTLEEIPPNSLIFQVLGKEESPVVGPYVMGNSNKDFVIPEKEKGDFRLQLPNLWCLYVKEDGEFVIQKEADPTALPDSSGTYIKWDVDGNIDIISEGIVAVEGSSELKLTVGSSVITISSSSIKMEAGGVTAELSGGKMNVS